ncbi:hypothetical protein K504DRAFT_38117 [Pleomassaria siparia CBS 279.74]|uniref:Uncharacterized protein n=1 Tax=Pleomassaria siparia CBS 279.74 TaxID=1314801 RepID=A0A6G1K588_9PLEO|nr:hypothetical protein K504DRAFT_38117 [Pleomassaria siparia CBS 279.74]
MCRVVRNSLESPMLALPPEIRNRIFEYALGGQHIHITTDPYPEEVKASNTWSPPAWLHGIPGFKTLSNRFSSNVEPTVRNLPGPSRFTLREAFSSRNDHEPTVSKFYNCVYPLDWQSYYSLIELPIDLNTLPDWRRLQHGRGIEPDIRVIKASNDHMTLVSAVCRQMYHETKFLPYKLNEFSFQDVGTMKDWFVNRGAAQKRMLQTIWLDLEWFCLCEDIIDFGRYMFGPASGLTTIRVSTLALIRVLEAYDNHPNPGMRSLLVNRLGDVQLRLRRTLRQNGDERPLQIKVVI